MRGSGIILAALILGAAPLETTPCVIPVEPVIVREATPIPVEQPPHIGLTTEERDLLERVVFAESGGEPTIESEMAVAQVILDRSQLWGKSVTEVILAPAQFGKPTQRAEVPERTKEAVRRVFDEGERIFPEPTTHFYAYNLCSPNWAETKVTRGVIAGHRFMY